MPPIPGANRGRLGQGIPGGAASLPGSLPLPGGGRLGPLPGSLPPIPGVRRPIQSAAPAPAPILPPAVRTDPRAAQEVGTGLSSLHAAQDRRQNSGSTKNITVALGVLDQVRKGKLDPKKAAKLMQGLTASDQAGLADLVSQRNSREGKVNMKELKALQELQKLPAPSDVESHDILSNLARDTEGLITGLPAGIGLSAAYLGKDTINTLRGKPSSNFLDKIVKPTAKTYKETYGPLVHGDVGGFYKQFHAHPLGPILDVASVLSAGAGVAGRVSRAGEALDRATAALSERSTKLPARTPLDTMRGMNDANAVDELGTPHRAFKSPTPQELKANPYMGKIVADIDPDTGKVHFGSGEHDDLWQRMDQAGVKPKVAATVILDPATGKPVRFNIGADGVRAGLSRDEIASLEAKGLKAAQAKVDHANSLPGSRLEPEIDDSGMSTFPDLEKGGPDVAALPGARGGHIADVHGAGKVVVDHQPFEQAIQSQLDELGVGDDEGVKGFLTDKIAKDYDPHTEALVKDLSKADVPVTVRPDLSHNGIEDLTMPDEKANPVYRVQVGDHPDHMFSVGVGKDGKRWVDDIVQFGDYEHFFEAGDDAARKAAHDDYFKAVEAAYGTTGPDTSNRITLWRAMDPKEHEAWKRGEPVPPGKFFADHPDMASGVDVTGQFPTKYKIIANRDDVVQTAPGIWQLKNEARFNEKGLLTSETEASPSRMVHADEPVNPKDLEPDTGIPQEYFQRPTPKEIEEQPYLNHFSVFYNTKTGKAIFGPTGSSHDEILEAPAFYGQDTGNTNDLLAHLNVARMARDVADPAAHGRDWIAGTGIFDPETGAPARINWGGEHSQTPKYKSWAEDALNQAHDKFWASSAKSAELPPPAPPPDLPAGVPPPPEPVPELTFGQKARVVVPAFLKAGGRGGLIDWYDERKGITHEAEIQDTMKQVASVLDDPDLRISRRTLGEVVKETAADIRATRAAGKARPAEMSAKLPQFISPGSSGRVLSAGETALREASDMIRAGAIYLRPAYLPNNWAGNTFMNVVHQGVLAPVNLAKSLVLDKNIGIRYTRAIDKAMGANPATVVTSGKGRGYVASLTQPAAHIMGAAADQPFRRAAFLHEARRAGFSKLSEVKDLFDKAASGDEASLRQIAEISRKGQEEIVKFGHMNDAERSLVRNLVFVYSWMRGAGRYAMRFPLQHPIQTNVFNAASGPGNQYTQSIMGGVPSFMSGVVPIGRGKDGNPIVINPFSLNPLGTGLQLLRAAAGTYDVLRNPKTFNKYAQTDVVDLLNPLLGAYISAREGGPSMKKQIENTIAAMALVKGLKHPGSGSIYPTSRGEAVGHFTLGSLFPREADQGAVTKSLEREQANNPIALIPQEIADFKKVTGSEPPYDLVIAYRKDLEDLARQKDFQAHYADSHGASGFRNMPPQNRLDAGIEFLKKHSKIDPATIKEIETTSKELTTDEEYNEYANAVWHLTGVGQWKDAWDSMVKSVKKQGLTRMRP